MFDYKWGHTAVDSRHTVLVIAHDQPSDFPERERQFSAAILSSGTDRIDRCLLASEKDLLVPGKYSILFSSPEAIVGASKWHDLLLSFPRL